MTRHAVQQLSGWGNHPREEVRAFRPESSSELQRTIAERAAESFISRGLGRSYGDAALNGGSGVIRFERLNRFLDWDSESQTVECEGGVSFDDLLRVFLPRGFFPPVTPGTKHVSVGGAIAADVHGKNHHRDGSIASFVESFRLLTGTGAILTCSRSENADLFWATLGGMGLTGAILSARLSLLPVETAFVSAEYRKAANLDEALELMSGDPDHRYSVAWIDCLASGAKLGRSVLIRGDHARVADIPAKLRAAPLSVPRRRMRSVPFHLPGFILNPVTVKAFNECFYRRHRQGPAVVDCESFFYPLDAIGNWNRIYGRRGFLQYQIVLPSSGSRAGLVEVLSKLSASRLPSFLAVLKTFGPGNQGPLSFPMPGATLALDLPNRGTRLFSLLNELDAIVLRHCGRVYLAKDARLSGDMFRSMYPRVGEFERVKRQVDPEGVFSSSLSRRLGLCVDREGPVGATTGAVSDAIKTREVCEV